MTTGVAAADWRATAAALHEVADRLAPEAPEAEERLRGRTGVVMGESLRRAVRSLRDDAEDAAAGGAALADVAAALEEARLDPSPEARHRLAVRMREATRVMRRIHGPTPPPARHGGATAGVSTTAATPMAADGHLTAGAAVGAALGAGLLTASAVRSRIPVNGGPERPRPGPAGSVAPAGRGRVRRDRRSRNRHALPAGTDEERADEDRGGPAVLA